MVSLFFIFGRLSDGIAESAIAGSVKRVILSRLGERQLAIWTASNFIGIVVVLTVVFPKAHFTNLKASAAQECAIAATGTAIRLRIFRISGNAFEHGNLSPANV